MKSLNRSGEAKPGKGSSGFTMVEMAIVMIISGLMFSVVILVMKYQLQQNTVDAMYENLVEMEGALTEYFARTGEFPCPAVPTAAQGDANYATEDCTAGIFATTQDANLDGTPDNILVGAFPYDTILAVLRDSPLSGKNTIDPWGNKYVYAVTETLTDASSFNADFGAISVVDEFDNSVINPPDRAHSVIFSRGPNQRDAYSRDGVQIDPYTILPPGPPPPPGTASVNEIENADYNGKFWTGVRDDDGGGAGVVNDDFLRFQVNKTSGLWQYVPGGVVNPLAVPPTPFIRQVTNMNSGNVGMGWQDPQERLDVAGDIKADQIRALDICGSENTAECMPTTRLAANDPEMQCGPGEAAISFSSNQINCTPITFPTFNFVCPAGQYLNGISTLGNVNCITP